MPSPWPTTGKWATDFKVEQSDYVDQDLRFAFGAIDRLDIEVDFDAKTITGWFQDRYEWHPVYAGLYKKWSDDDARETNCVHAALVELQSGTAADYWMKGEATVPLSVLSAGAGEEEVGRLVLSSTTSASISSRPWSSATDTRWWPSRRTWRSPIR